MKEKVGWIETELLNVSNKITDGSHNPPPKSEFGEPMLSAQNIYNDNILFEGYRLIKSEDFEEESKRANVEPGDVLLTIVGTIGRSTVVPEKIKRFTLQRSVALIKPKVINPYYLSFYLRSPESQLFFQQNSKGTAQQGIYLNSLKILPVSLAPLPEQRAIVSKIELLFSELDNGIANLKLAQEQLKVYRQAVLKKAFEGKLSKKWREKQTDLPDAEELLEQIKKKREIVAKTIGRKLKKVIPLTEAELEELSRTPEGWIWTSINQICFVDVGFAFKSAEFVDEGIRLLRGDNIEPGSLRWENTKCLPKEKIEDYKNLIVKKDEIILAMDRPLISSGLKLAMAKESDVPCLLVQRMARFLPISIDNKYLYYSLQTKDFIHHLLKGQTGTQLPHISETNISSYILSLPSLAEQKIIVEEIETRLSVCDKIEQDIKENLEKAEALRQSILKKAFEGKLLNERELAEVRKAEDWEPAEVLLERVKAEKTASGKKGRS